MGLGIIIQAVPFTVFLVLLIELNARTTGMVESALSLRRLILQLPPNSESICKHIKSRTSQCETTVDIWINGTKQNLCENTASTNRRRRYHVKLTCNAGAGLAQLPLPSIEMDLVK